MASNRSSGFSIVESIIAVIVIVILGFIGWRVYTTYNASHTPKTSSQTSVGTKSPTPANQTSQNGDPNAGYFVIKEWGVRLKSDSGLSDLQYTLDSAPDDASVSFAKFTTPEVNALDPHCDRSQPSGWSALGDISRYPADDTQPITGALPLASLYGYKYYIGYPQALCLQNPTASSEKVLNDTANLFHSSIKSLEPAQGTYLDIKELGIRILLNDQISDAVYAPWHDPASDGNKYISVSAQFLIDKETSNYCEAPGGAVGIIAESSTPFPALPQGNTTLPPDGKNVFKLGGNYYLYNRPQNDGCAIGQVTTDMQEAKIKAFGQAITTLQLDK